MLITCRGMIYLSGLSGSGNTPRRAVHLQAKTYLLQISSGPNFMFIVTWFLLRIFSLYHMISSLSWLQKFTANVHFYLSRCCVALLIMINFCVVRLKHCISGLMNIPNMLIIKHSPKFSCFAESEEPWWMCRIGKYLVKVQEKKKCHIQQDFSKYFIHI